MNLFGTWLVALIALVAILVLPFVIPALRRLLISKPLLVRFRRVMPRMSQTERDALEAGTVSFDGELFSGRPAWSKLLAIAKSTLTADEQHFLDHEVETLCAMVSDWETTNVHKDLPPPVWRYIREHGFLGMIIPKAYGGLGFSAYAHSEVVTKLSTRCASVAVTVLVPNSLGPGELLLHYGTDAQKRHYLPRLLSLSVWRQRFARRRRPVAARPAEPAFEVEPLPPKIVRAQLAEMLHRGLKLDFVYSGGVARYFNHVRQFRECFGRLADHPCVSVSYFKEADHTYVLSGDRQRLLDHVAQWMGHHFPITRTGSSA